jgi:penicillin amidase
MRRRLLLLAGLLLVVMVAGAGLWARRELRASLPLLDGTYRLAGASAPVTVTRDALGIPVIQGRTREDVARATGFLHAQDRFFQMDLTRRRAAGELAALVGRRALPADLKIRNHRFRAEAITALSMLSPPDRAVLEAYTAGVNSGLDALTAPPFEYLLLRQTPEPWRAEDSLLVVLAMFIRLQDDDGTYESVLATMHDTLPPAMFDFMASPGTEWDAPVVGERFGVPAVPGPDVYNLRARRSGKPNVKLARSASLPSPARRNPAHVEVVGRVPTKSDPPSGNWDLGVGSSDGEAVGSNNWVVSGRLTPDNAPLVANDMHLDVRVPNTWYRAQLEWPVVSNPDEPPGGGGGGFHRLVGVTLPGSPAVVVGSNTFIAWGFTNTYADWSDFVLLEVDPKDPSRYRTPAGWKEFDTFDEVIKVAGEDTRAYHQLVTWTIWGPVLEPDHRGRQRAYRWVAHSAERLAAAVIPLETTRDVFDAFNEANGLGTPGQNMVVADRDGHIGWTVYGSIPRREGTDGQLPSSWADGTRRWNGWLDDAEYPRLVDPPGGRIWTANARVVDGAMLSKLGDGGYEVGSRATIIRDRLSKSERFTEGDMLAIQLDASAVFLSRWRDLILKTLTPGIVAGRPDRATFRDLVDHSWDGRASPQSVGYRFTRMFREEVSEAVMTFVLSECYEADVNFDHTALRRREGPLWKLLTGRPMHLLDPQFDSWDGLLVQAVDDVIARAREDGALADRVWSEYNVTAYLHPLASSVPVFGRLLNMPAAQVPGDLFTVRMHWGSESASERFVVSPGHEAKGILHMPTGQSGHPLSPFYANSHAAWVTGEGTPLMAGKEEHRLTLTP